MLFFFSTTIYEKLLVVKKGQVLDKKKINEILPFVTIFATRVKSGSIKI